jgi:hypothetical protein
MSYFYILPGPYRVGFGITGDFKRREKDYTGAWGGIAEFAYLFEGTGTHVKRLENIIKVQNRDMLWKVDEWETEWLDNNWTAEQLLYFVTDIIDERHLKLTRIR